MNVPSNVGVSGLTISAAAGGIPNTQINQNNFA